jgi:hypothetical protein
MRTVAEIPHSRFKITVFNWNAKYILKIELDVYEQVYKLPEDAVTSLEQVKAMVTPTFLDSCFQRFLSMRKDFTETYTLTKNK